MMEINNRNRHVTRFLSALLLLGLAILLAGCAGGSDGSSGGLLGGGLAESPDKAILGLYENAGEGERAVFREDGTCELILLQSWEDMFRKGTYEYSAESDTWNLYLDAESYSSAYTCQAYLDDGVLHVSDDSFSGDGMRRIATVREMQDAGRKPEGQYQFVDNHENYLSFSGDTCRLVQPDGSYQDGRIDYVPTDGTWMLSLWGNPFDYLKVYTMRLDGNELVIEERNGITYTYVQNS